MANTFTNIPGIGGGGIWGSITGTLSDQTDLFTELGLKEVLANKDIDGTLSTNSDTKYPSQKAVKTYVDNSVSAGITFPILAPDGSAVSPSYGFSTDIGTDTGMFHPGDGILAWSTNATENMTLTGADLNVVGNFSAANYPPTGSSNTIAAYDGTGALTSLPDRTWGTVGGATAISDALGYTIPVDGTPGYVKLNNQEVEWNATNSNTDQTLVSIAMDSHVDRSHGGGDVASVLGLTISASVEGSGTVTAHTALSMNHNLQGDSGGETTSAQSIGITAGAAPLYTIGTYRGFGANFVAQATSIVGDVLPFSFGTSGDLTGQYQGSFLNHNGNIGTNFLGTFTGINGDVAGSATMINSNMTGDVVGSFTGAIVRHDGASDGFSGLIINQVGSFTTTNNTGVRIEFGNGDATSKTAFSIVMGDGNTSISGRVEEVSWGAGSYDNRIAWNLGGGTGDITTSDTALNIGQTSGTSQSFTGLNIIGSGTTDNWRPITITANSNVVNAEAAAIKISLNSITGLPTGARAKAMDIDGGVINQNMGTTTISSHPFTLDTGNNIGVSLQIESGTPITGTEFAGTNFRNSFQFEDDMGTGPIGLGWTGMMDTPFFFGTAGKTVDKASMFCWVPLVAGGTGGTITEFSYLRTFNMVNFGGTTPTIPDAYVFKFDSSLGPLSSTATKAHGLFLDDSGMFNYVGGKTRFGGTSYTEATVSVDVYGATRVETLDDAAPTMKLIGSVGQTQDLQTWTSGDLGDVARITPAGDFISSSVEAVSGNITASSGNLVASGDVSGATVTPANGASGTFTTTDLKTVTVTNGIITSIV